MKRTADEGATSGGGVCACSLGGSMSDSTGTRSIVQMLHEPARSLITVGCIGQTQRPSSSDEIVLALASIGAWIVALVNIPGLSVRLGFSTATRTAAVRVDGLMIGSMNETRPSKDLPG